MWVKTPSLRHHFTSSFLAGCFAISGFSFLPFFPLQALLGGFTSGFVGLIAFETFQDARAAAIAGLLTATHPILVNTASQPYNENLFFFLFAVAIWAFLVSVRTQRLRWTLLCGATVGLCTLTRETGLPLLVAMLAAEIWNAPRSPRSWVRCGVLTLAAIVVIAPWTVRNYLRFGSFVPVASILGSALALGNNECVVSESFFVPYWAEGACPPLDQRRSKIEAYADPSLLPAAIRFDHISAIAAMQFISKHPGSYAKLALRRLWTTLLPFDPRANQRLVNRISFVAYWLVVFPAGFVGLGIKLKRMETRSVLLV